MAEAADEEMKGGEEAPKEKEAKDEAATSAKTEDSKAEEAPKEPEKPKETESDAPEDDRAKLTEALGFNTEDTTLNAVSSAGGKVLLALAEGGLQHLLVGARANVGVKAGRYMFEAMVLAEKPASPQGQQSTQQRQPPVVRLGFAAAGSSLFLADGDDCVCFDTDGFFAQGRLKRRVSQKFGPEQVVAVVLNLDAESRNANTVSLFRNGVRISEPQPLPECLRGKTLFPAVSFKGAALRLNFAGPPLKPLPFRCRMIQNAASADCDAVPPALPEDGKFEMAMPVALPEEGYFDWVDQFLAKNTGYVELSNRAIIDWATKSGVWRKSSGKGCNDRPETGFGVPQLDDMSVPRLLAAVAPALPRNFVIPEVKGNLLPDFRKVLLERFANFRKTAYVMMGEPGEDFKQGVQVLLLQEKRAKAELEAKKKKQEADRKRLVEAKRKQLKAAKDGDGEKEEPVEDEKMDEKAEEEVGVELTEEEKKVVFRKKALPDILATDLAKAFTKFTLPTEEEGFDKISFEWQPVAAATGYLREWVLQRKATQRVEDIQPTKWFKENLGEWQKLLMEWKKKQTEWKKVIDQLQEWKKEGKKKTPEDEKKEGDDKPTEIDAEDIDVFRVENVCDVGSGEPLFANFEYEDWCLLALRYELHLLVNAFRKDMDDPERPTFHENHLIFYYNRYFTKPLDLKIFNVSSNRHLVEMIKDTMAINSTTGMLECHLGEETQMDNFVKLAEEHRRDRQRRLDAGDESAELKFLKPAPAQAARPPQNQNQQWQKVSGGQAAPVRYTPAVRPAAPQSAVPSRTQFQAAPRAAGTIQPVRTAAAVQPAVAAAQKRPYTPAPKATIIPAAKQARTAYTGQGSSRW